MGTQKLPGSIDAVTTKKTRYQDAGIHWIAHDFYPGGSCEMLNDTRRAEVRAHLLGWTAAVLDSQAGTSGNFGSTGELGLANHRLASPAAG